MTFWLGVLIGFVSSFVVSLGYFLWWWFRLTRGNPERASKLSADFEEVREAIRNANAGRLN